MANEKNFKIKNGLTINGTEVISSAGAMTAVGLVKLDYTNPTISFRPDNSAHFNIKANESPARLEIGHSVNKNLYLSNTGGATFNYNVTIQGNLTVNGTTVTNSATNTTIEDALIELGSGNTGANTNDLGLILERGTTGSNMFVGFDESQDAFVFANTTSTGATTGNVTIDGYQKFVAGHGSRISGDLQIGDTLLQNSYGILQVNQTSNVDEEGIGILSSGGGRSMRLWVDETNSYVSSGNGGSGNLIFNEAITVSSGGNLTGVGTISSGAITVDKDLNAAVPTSTNSHIFVKDTNALAAENGGAIVFSGIYNSSGSHLGQGPYIKGYKVNANDGDYGFGLKLGVRETGSGGSNVAMTIDDSSNVGIGTTSPNQRLVIADSTGETTLAINNSTTTIGNRARLDFRHNGITGSQIKSGAIEDFTTTANRTSDLRFFTRHNGTIAERLRIKEDGNVGIGTTSPDRKLEVENTAGNGEVAISGTTGADLYFRPTTSYSSGGNFGIKVDGGTSSPFLSTMEFSGYNNGINAIMTLKGDGKVGIGTTTPANKLDVEGTIYSQGGIRMGSSASGEGIFRYNPGAGSGIAIATQLFTTAGIKMFIAHTAAGGGVGIGTTSPAFKFHTYDPSTNVVARFESGDNQVWIDLHDDGSGAYGALLGHDSDEEHLFVVADAGVSKKLVLHDNGALTLNNTSKLDSAVRLQTTGSSSGVTSFSSFADDVIFEHNNNIGITLATTQSYAGTLAFADPDSGSAGWLQYDHATNNMNFRVNSGERMRIDSSGSVLIGKTAANIGTTGIQLLPNGFTSFTRANDSPMYLVRTSSGGSILEFSIGGGGTDSAIGTTGSDDMTFYTGAAATDERMRLTTTGLGIGTTSPSAKLDVNGGSSGTDTDVFRISSSTGAFNVRCSDLSAANPTWTLRTFSAEPIAFAIATTEAMRIDGSGNVGIGTTSPSKKLHVSGSSPVIRLEDTTDPQTSGGSVGKIEFYGNDGSSGGAGVRSYLQTVSTNAAGNDHALAIGLSSSNTAPTEKIRLTNTGLGIGTTSPTAKLDINGPTKLGSGSFSGSVDTQTDTALVVPQTKKIYSLSSSGQYLRNIFYHDGGNGHFIFGQQGTSLIADMIFYPGSSGNMRFYASGSEDVRINASGLMGIGTTSPSKRLEVVNANSGSNFAGIQLRNNTTTADSSAELRFVISTDTTSTLNSGFIKAVRNAGDNNDLLFGTVGSERMRIKNDGKVGIGTDSPSAKLDVAAGNITAGVKGVEISGNTSYIADGSHGTSLDISHTYSSNDGSFRVLNIDLTDAGTSNQTLYGLYVNAEANYFSGNVGIGVTNPTRKLHIDSAGTTTGAAYIYSNAVHTGVTTQSILAAYSDNASSSGTVLFVRGDGSGNLVHVKKGSADALVIDSSQRVGIGTASPNSSTKVHIAKSGEAYARVESTSGGGARLQLKTETVGYAAYSKLDFIYGASDTVAFSINGGDTVNTMAFDVGGSERARIDSSGNFLVGKTTSASSTAGLTLEPAGALVATRSGGEGLIINRLTSEGALVKFRYANSEVGNIGSLGNYLTIGDEDTAIRFHAGVDAILPHNSSTNANRDDAISLGTSTERFKDLYLGGTITGTTATFSTALDASITVQSTDATTGIVFTDNGGTGHLYYLGGSDKFYTDGKLAVNGSTLSGGMVFQVNGNSNFAGTITSNNDMAIDTDTLFVDVSTDRVGINAGTSPSYSLHVSGDIYSSDTIQTKEFQNIKLGDASIPANTAGYYKIAEVVRGTGTIQLSFTGGNHSPTTYVIHYFKNWSTSVEVKLNQYGAATHITKARIRKDSDDNDKYFVEVYFASNSNAPSFQVFHKQLDGYFNGTNQVFTGSLTAGSTNGVTYAEEDFTINGMTTERLNVTRINDNAQILVIGDTSGTTNVGIGDTSPAYALEVNEASNYAGVHIRGSNAPSLSFGRGSNSTQEWKVGLSGTNGDNFAISTGTANADRLIIDTTGNVGIGAAPAFTLGSGLEIQRGGTTTLRLENTAASKTVEFNMGTDLEIKTLNSGSNIILTPTANVGIGNDTPLAKLDVTGQINIRGTTGLYLNAADGTTFRAAFHDDGTRTRLFADGNGSNPHMTFNGGNVGVGLLGANHPSARLHVQGSGATVTSLVECTDGNQASLDLKNSEGHYRIITNGGQLQIYDQTDSRQPFTIDTSGNVGIGTTSPGDKLDVAGNVDIGTNKLYNGASNNSAGLDFSGSFVKLHGYNGIVFYSSNAGIGSQTERMRITSGGDVGIGESSPTHRLHVTDSQNASTGITIENTGDTGGNINASATLFLKGTTGTNEIKNYFGNLYLRTNTNHSISFYTNGANNRMSIDGSGNISVGGQTIINQARNMSNIGNISSTGLVTIDANGNGNTLHIHDDSTGGQPGMAVTTTGNTSTSTQTFYAKQYGSAVSVNLFGQSIGGKAFVGTEGSASGGLLIGTVTSDNIWIGTNNTLALTIDSSQNATFAGNITATGASHTFYSGGSEGSLAVGRTSGQAIRMHVNDNNNTIFAYQDSDSNGAHYFDLRRDFQGTGTNSFRIRKGSVTQIDVDTDGDLNVALGDIKIGSTVVIDSSRNLTNIASYTGGTVKITSASMIRNSSNNDLFNYSSNNLTVGDASEEDAVEQLNLTTMAGVANVFIDGNNEYVGFFGTGNSSWEARIASNGTMHLDSTLTQNSGSIGSDIKLKKNIQPIESALDTVEKLRGVHFEWKKSGKEAIGFIAQEVEEILPQLVQEADLLGEEDKTFKSLDYISIIPILVEAIKEQQKEIERLKEHSHPAKDMCEFEGYHELMARIKKLEENNGNN